MNENEVIEIIDDPLGIARRPKECLYKLYKLRNKITGEYSNGKVICGNEWNATGKTWNNLKSVKNFLKNFVSKSGWHGVSWKNIEIVCLEVYESETMKCSEMIEEMMRA